MAIATYTDAPSAVTIVLGGHSEQNPGSQTGGDGNDRLLFMLGAAGTAYADSIDGGGSDDWLYGGDGNDIIIGGTDVPGDFDADWIEGGAGNDCIRGGTGNDYDRRRRGR